MLRAFVAGKDPGGKCAPNINIKVQKNALEIIFHLKQLLSKMKERWFYVSREVH